MGRCRRDVGRESHRIGRPPAPNGPTPRRNRPKISLGDRVAFPHNRPRKRRYNTFVGHRRWILYPPTTVMGTGDVADRSFSRANALWVISGGPEAAPATRDGFVAWPPPGYVPASLVFPRWSFAYPGADFSAVSVTMTRGGQAVPLWINPVANGYADNTAIWEADSPAADVTTDVTLANVLVSGKPRTFTYQVTTIDPGKAGTDTVTPRLFGPDQLATGRTGDFTFSPVPGATGYRWRSGRLAPLGFIANAGGGSAGGMTGIPDTKELVQKGGTPGGSGVYRLLGIGYFDNGYPASMRINPLIVPLAGSKLQFSSRFATVLPTAQVHAQIRAEGDPAGMTSTPSAARLTRRKPPSGRTRWTWGRMREKCARSGSRWSTPPGTSSRSGMWTTSP